MFKNDQNDPAYLGYDRSYDRNTVIVQATGHTSRGPDVPRPEL